MTTGSNAPAGSRYVITRDWPPKTTSGARVYITAEAHVLNLGPWTEVLANARRWPSRPACWRWLRRRQEKNQIKQATSAVRTRLDDGWYMKRESELALAEPAASAR
jgi:hypothetical protein